jgi:hypothetical protein
MLVSALPLKRIAVGLVGAHVAALALSAGCGKGGGGGALTPAEELDGALRPAALAAVVRRLGGAHFTGTTAYRLAVAEKASEDGEAVTTTTDLWLDRQGQYRLVESNDRDGGREVVLHGHDLAVAIKPGRMIRRAAQEPEPTRILEEAVGGPWSAWETVRRFASVERSAPGVFKIIRSAAAVPVAASIADTTPLRRWRDTVSVQVLEGEARFDPKTGAPLAFNLKARFTATREDKVALSGDLAVSTRTEGIGAAPAIAAPPAEPLQVRQRTILEERALLGAAPKEAR